MSGIREGMEKVSQSESLAVLWVTRPGVAVTIGLVMAFPPLLRGLLEAIGLR
jgi:hypothetical protein